MSAPQSLTIGSLFSGIGGLELGLERAGLGPVVWQVEKDAYCRAVLAKHWPDATRYEDVKDVGRANLVPVDVICGGFPCQNISSAGTKEGIDGERSGLWAEYARIIRELRPRYVVVENVAALLGRGIDRVLGDLAAVGYDAEWACIPASALGAPHERDRLWLVAYPNGNGQPTRAEHDEARWLSAPDGVVHAECGQREVAFHVAGAWRIEEPLSWDRVWPGEHSPLGMGVDDGFPERLDRLRALGNAVVPQVAEVIGRVVLALEAQRSSARSPLEETR